MSSFPQELKMDSVPQQPAKKSYVHLLHTDITRFDEAVDPDAWILVGNVNFRRDSMYMYCDSAHYLQKRNALVLYGRYRIRVPRFVPCDRRRGILPYDLVFNVGKRY
jgi:lipopolysaccharide assembly outer membrane protein LptD (OstA)